MQRHLFCYRYIYKLFPKFTATSTIVKFPTGRCSCSHLSNTHVRELPKLETSRPGLLESWFYGVQKFGKLNISVPFSLRIESLDPQEYLNMGKLIIKLDYSLDNDEWVSGQYNNTSLAALTKLYNFEVETSEENEFSDITICAKFNTMATFPAICTIQMPINYNLSVNCTGNITSVKNLEANEIIISTINSNCTLEKIKGEFVTASSKGGDITCKKLVQGNINMSIMGKGSISTERLQGQSVKCSVEEGNIKATSIYSIASEFTCNHGNINLINNHGKSKTTVNRGNLVIDSLDGSLEANVINGSTDVFISRPDDVTIETETGDINIKLPETSTAFDLEGNCITCDKNLNINEEKRETKGNKEKLIGNLSGTEGKIKARTQNGNITVKCLDWMESLRLKGFNKTE